jgi:hypothetical protein
MSIGGNDVGFGALAAYSLTENMADLAPIADRRCRAPISTYWTSACKDDGDPGAIAEAYYTIEDGVVVLRDRDDKHLTSRALLKGQDPLAVARTLLREAEEPESFNHPIRYPKLGLA